MADVEESPVPTADPEPPAPTAEAEPAADAEAAPAVDESPCGAPAVEESAQLVEAKAESSTTGSASPPGITHHDSRLSVLDESHWSQTEQPVPETRSQREMVDYCKARVKNDGIVLKKQGQRWVRRAKKGEAIHTHVCGKPTGFARVCTDETSYVLRQGGPDHEIFLMTKEEFEKSYELVGSGTTSRCGDFDLLANRLGFVVLLEITDEDIEFCKDGFVVGFSVEKQILQKGDYLAMPFPLMDEVYICHQAVTIYKLQRNPASMVANQRQMAEQFASKMLEFGTVFDRDGLRLARPSIMVNGKFEAITTFVDGVPKAKRIATDDNYMVVLHQFPGDNENSGDTEVFLLTRDEFDLQYELATEAEPVPSKYARNGFQYYKRKGKTSLIQLTEEDIASMPMGFWTSWSDRPIEAKVGDYLATPSPMDPERPDFYICFKAPEIYGVERYTPPPTPPGPPAAPQQTAPAGYQAVGQVAPLETVTPKSWVLDWVRLILCCVGAIMFVALGYHPLLAEKQDALMAAAFGCIANVGLLPDSLGPQVTAVALVMPGVRPVLKELLTSFWLLLASLPCFAIIDGATEN